MITIDGAAGEGGGQVLRTALSLSLVTGRPFRIDRIRGGRKKPGLMRQHLASVNAAAAVGDAEVAGNQLGSTALTFQPRAVRTGRYHFDVGSAGSATLVFQTLLPALLRAREPSELVLGGGTHNPWAPPFEFIEGAFLPVVNRMGPAVRVALDVPGFYPAGGGRFQAHIAPTQHLAPLSLVERGPILEKRATAMVSRLPAAIARRELAVVADALGWPQEALSVVETTRAAGPGNVLSLVVRSEGAGEVVTGFGRRGVPAESVALEAVRELLEYLESEAPVGRHLADQLLVPMALAGGGAFRTLSPSGHTTSNIAVIHRFLDIAITVERVAANRWEIAVRHRRPTSETP